MQFMPLVRYVGAKRKQSEEIIGKMPTEVGTMWIPFLGSGAVMFQFINSNIKYDRIVCSDIYQPLIGIFELTQKDPQKLIDSYYDFYKKTIEGGEDFYRQVVAEFNSQPLGEQSPEMFYYITRACMRGNLDYDNNGNFISGFQKARGNGSDGISNPNTVENIIKRWHDEIQDVEFRCEPYDAMVNEIKEGDFVFLDPPYIDGTWYHDHNMDYKAFYDFLRGLPCDYSITLNGDRDIYPIPDDCYTDHCYIYYGVKRSASGRQIGSRDSYWMKRTDNYKYDETEKLNIRQTERGHGGHIPQINDIKMYGDIQKEIGKQNERIDNIESNINQILTILKEGINK
jgi:DNA adenine methylase